MFVGIVMFHAMARIHINSNITAKVRAKMKILKNIIGNGVKCSAENVTCSLHSSSLVLNLLPLFSISVWVLSTFTILHWHLCIAKVPQFITNWCKSLFNKTNICVMIIQFSENGFILFLFFFYFMYLFCFKLHKRTQWRLLISTSTTE